MKLQQKMTCRIEEYGGIEKLNHELERIRLMTDEKKWFDNMIFYFNSLYTQVVDVESLAIEYRQTSLDTVEFLEQFNKRVNEPTLKFMIDLINYKLASVSGVVNIS